MGELFEVYSCTSDSLKSVLSEKTKIPSGELDAKAHINYFADYFQAVKAKTFVVENEYVDHDYLEDHAEYYVRCFSEYKRKCSRLHFFKNSFSLGDFERLLNGEDGPLSSELLQEEYLGFVVVKPLPKTIIGRTCLATYEHEGRRFFPITRAYSANLYGIDLVVKSSLAFQEQDTVVAACATSALWSVFQGTGKLFQHAIPSPSAITKTATEHITDGERTRAFPSKGLDVIEMARAIRSVDLEPYTVNVANEYLLKSTAYAYLRMGIPMIMGFPLFDVENIPNEMMGKHAVALTGYSLPKGDPIPFGPSGFQLKAHKIDKLYAHDDQVGPFARMEFDGEPVSVDGQGGLVALASLSTSWSWLKDSGNTGVARAVPEILLVPLYNKVRIPFGCVHDRIVEFNPLVREAFLQTKGTFQEPDKYEWDIYLTTVNTFKSELAKTPNIDPATRRDTLTAGMPKYIWRATATYKTDKVLDILFDATDLEQGAFLIKLIGYSPEFSAKLKEIAQEPFIEQAFRNSIAWSIIAWTRQSF